jgi:uncharacterized protein (DUF1501 family)
MGGYDMHSEVTQSLKTNFQDLNDAVSSFVSEMKSMGVWEDIVIVQTSEFARTLAPNSGGGTDHGYGGNSWVSGGAVKGGRVLGTYPSSFAEDSVDRGRIPPTTPFDAIFNAVSNWVGVTNPEDLLRVLPNREKFDNLFYAGDMFDAYS